jgi:glycosyltransferase involved in cell wall biosynthesis
MRLGVALARDTWRFFDDIFQDFNNHYKVDVFQRRQVRSPFFQTRINRYVFNRDLQTFLEQHDIVFFEWASDLLVEATRLPKKTRIVTRLHRYEMFKWAPKVNWDKVDRVIVVSEAMRQKFAERFPENGHKVVVVNEGISIQNFQPVEKAYSGDIGTLCFLTPRKRVYELILAFAELDRKASGFRLHIGGDSDKFPDYNDAVYSLVRKLGLQDKVRFYGEIKEPQSWYGNIDIFVSNSYSEGLQVAPMEAMASGRYCLSHHWDGAEELLPVENLFLTNSELHSKILAYQDMDEIEKKHQQEKLRSIVCENFDIEIIKKQIKQIIVEVAEEKAPAI